VTLARHAINRNLTKAQTAAKKIRHADQSLLRRRVEVPGAIAEGLDADQKLIGRIRGLVRGGTIDGYNEAVDRINEVIQAWRELLG
jgi:hypothetical protein